MAYRFDDYLLDSPNKTWKVYKVLTVNNKIIYIGCTSHALKYRFTHHVANKYGSTIKLIKEFDNPFQASELEVHLIARIISMGFVLLNKSLAHYAQVSSIYKYKWIMNRGGIELLKKFRDRELKRHEIFKQQMIENFNKLDRHLTLEVSKK